MSIYLDYFGLNEPPFAITPDPRYIYLSGRHEDALAHLLYGIGQGGSGGFVQLTGEVGTGKTTLCRCLLEQVPEKTRIALILNPMLKPRDLLQAICDELRLQHGRSDSSRELVNRLYAHLLEAHGNGERVVLVIDEAQNMSRDALEQVRLLTNLETHTDKLLQIILLGQPELRELLARQELRQLAQRITARYHLQPLDSDETEAYVRHRLAVAGCKRPLFNRASYKALYQLSGGVPRLINILADRALLGAYASDVQTVNAVLVKQANQEVRGDFQIGRSKWFSAPTWLVSTALTALLVSVSYAGYRMWPAGEQQPSQLPIATVAGMSADQALVAAVDQPAVEKPDTGEILTVSSSASLTNRVASLTQTNHHQSIDEWLAAGRAQGVWSRWAGLWRLDQQRITAACEQADTDSSALTGVFCTRQPGGWNRIRQLNLPVLINLDNSDTPMLVEGLQSRQVLLHNGRLQRWWPFAELLDHWSGGYTAVCPGSTQAWREGMQDIEVQRLKKLAAGLPEQPYRGLPSEDYGKDFADWVAGFQIRNGLTSDRILGQESKLFLCAAGEGIPQLQTVTNAALLAEGE